MKDTIQIEYGSFENIDKSDKKPKSKKLYIMAIIMLMVTITLVMGVNNNNKNKIIRIRKENEEKGLGLEMGLAKEPWREYLKNNNYELIITSNFDDVKEKENTYYRIYDDVTASLSCYTETTYPVSSGSYVYCDTGYSVTGCSAYNGYNATRYGAWGGYSGNYCYSKDYMLQARCCKATTGTLSMNYLPTSSLSLSTCISATCVGNTSATGSGATLGWYATEKYYGIGYYQRSDLNTYGVKAEVGGVGSGYLWLNAFCGNVTSGYLYCTPKYGSPYGGSYSIATCSSGVMTGCDARILNNVCSTGSTYDGKLYGTYFTGNYCYAFGTTNVVAVAICCSII